MYFNASTVPFGKVSEGLWNFEISFKPLTPESILSTKLEYAFKLE